MESSLGYIIKQVAHKSKKVTFFSAVSSSSVYSERLGGTATFSGLVIGIPPAVSAVTLAPIMRIDQGEFRFVYILYR